MLTCHIVQDLLPMYIEGLVSEETARDIQQHLAGCPECEAYYQQLITPIQTETELVEVQEIDFLKKVRQRFTKRLAVILLLVGLVFSGAAYLYAVGQPLRSDEVDVTRKIADEQLLLDFSKPKTGFLKVTSKVTVNEDGSYVVELTPKKLLKMPFDDVGEGGFSWAWVLNTEQQEELTFVIKFKDRELVFEKDDF